MGIFDKIKQAKNFITGGGAKLQIEQLSNNVSDGSLTFKISCQIADTEMDITNAYFIIRSTEEVNLKDYDFSDSDGSVRREHISRQNETYSAKTIIAEAQTLEANSNHEWEVEVTLPNDIYGTYNGVLSRHVWEAFAGLDKSGNDPDSGWVEIEVIK